MSWLRGWARGINGITSQNRFCFILFVASAERSFELTHECMIGWGSQILELDRA